MRGAWCVLRGVCGVLCVACCLLWMSCLSLVAWCCCVSVVEWRIVVFAKLIVSVSSPMRWPLDGVPKRDDTAMRVPKTKSVMVHKLLRE